MLDMAEAQKFARLLETLAPDHHLLRTWPLAGGVSAQVTALEIRTPTGDTQRWIARQHGPRDLARNPHLAEDEFRLLQILQTTGIPVPAPLHLAPAGIFPAPLLITAFIEGQPNFPPADLPNHLPQLAARLAQLHRLDPAPFAFLPRQNPIP
ncbi:MAG: phosphotransferase, partial [Anaerolineales bacterium]|nr:phosphotransferase [Anaerolineales bacterium]